MAFLMPVTMANYSMMARGMTTDRTEVRCGNLKSDFPLQGWYDIGWLVISVLCFILSPFTTGMNFVVLLTILTKRRLRTVSNLLLASLAFPDMFCGCISQPIYGAILLQTRLGRVDCGLFTFSVVLSYILGTASFFTILLITLERYLAVFHPYWYERRLDKKTMLLKVLVVLWIIVLTFNPLSLLTKQFLLTSIIAAVTFPLIITFSFFVHFRIIYLVRHIHTSIKRQEQSVAPTDCCNSAAVSRATRVAILILLTLVICYTPYSVVVIYGYSVSHPSDQLFVANGYVQVFLLLNSFLNPLLYFFQLKDLRKEIRSLMWRSEDSRERSVSSTSSKTVVPVWKRSVTPSLAPTSS